MNFFQVIFVPLSALIALIVFVRTLRRRMPGRNGLFWTFVWAGAAVFIAFPSFTALVAKRLGIGRGADLIFYLATLAGLGGALYFYGRYRALEALVSGVIRREVLRVPRRGGDRQASSDGSIS
jgi:hypothetical protein